MNKPSINLLQHSVSRKSFVEDMMDLTNDNFNGANGPEVLSREAKETGFDSDLAFHCSEAERIQSGNLLDMITHVLRANYAENSRYLDFLLSHYPIDKDTVIVAVAYLS